jgi:hypothetical protein
MASETALAVAQVSQRPAAVIAKIHIGKLWDLFHHDKLDFEPLLENCC